MNAGEQFGARLDTDGRLGIHSDL